MRRFVIRVLTIAGVLGVMVPIGVTAASAGTDQCESTHFCAWENNDFAPGGNPAGEWFGGSNSWGSAIRNDDESSYNHGTSGLVVRSYTSDNQTGTVIVCLPRDWAVGYETPENNGQSHEWSSTACSHPGP